MLGLGLEGGEWNQMEYIVILTTVMDMLTMMKLFQRKKHLVYMNNESHECIAFDLNTAISKEGLKHGQISDQLRYSR